MDKQNPVTIIVFPLLFKAIMLAVSGGILIGGIHDYFMHPMKYNILDLPGVFGMLVGVYASIVFLVGVKFEDGHLYIWQLLGWKIISRNYIDNITTMHGLEIHTKKRLYGNISKQFNIPCFQDNANTQWLISFVNSAIEQERSDNQKLLKPGGQPSLHNRSTVKNPPSSSRLAPNSGSNEAKARNGKLLLKRIALILSIVIIYSSLNLWAVAFTFPKKLLGQDIKSTCDNSNSLFMTILNFNCQDRRYLKDNNKIFNLKLAGSNSFITNTIIYIEDIDGNGKIDYYEYKIYPLYPLNRKYYLYRYNYLENEVGNHIMSTKERYNPNEYYIIERLEDGLPTNLSEIYFVERRGQIPT
jgi:hypothetical protein